MRKLLLLIVTAVACTSTHSPAPTAIPAGPAQPYSLSFDEEATIVALEDRRQYDPALVDAWIHHKNPMHRARVALALGRIGPHTFVDSNGNGEHDPAERQAGVDELAALVSDSDARVRVTAAFALGEIGDASGVETLFRYTTDADGDVAAEATEALSKITEHVPLDRYAALTADNQRESVRARAVRFLFRFGSDEASAVAANLLGSSSPAIRQEAAYALARRAYPPARARLELLISDSNAQTRAYVVRALGGIAATESLNPIVAALGDEHPWVRTNAAVALARIAAKDATILDRAEHAHRVIAVSEDADAGTRASAIDALGYYAKRNEAARKRLLEIAASGTRWDRELAIGAIAKHLADATLIPAGLTTWGKVRVLEAANAVADDARVRYFKDSEPQVRSAALASIADDKVDAHIDAIRAALDDEDVIVRGYAIDRYGKSHDTKRVEVLRTAELRARKDQQNDARLSAIRALGEIEDEGREPFLRELIRDDDPVVRRVAADLIEQKLGKRRPQFTPLKTTADYRAIVEWARTPHTATIHMARGRVEVALLTQDAPMTTWNFARLAQRKFFDGTTFMRVVPNFVIQGGDPRNDTEGGPGYSIRDEINLQKYTRGAVGMALSGPDTGGSQYFITHSPQPHLDGGYTIFGRVTGGMTAVVDQTERGDRVETIGIDER